MPPAGAFSLKIVDHPPLPQDCGAGRPAPGHRIRPRYRKHNKNPGTLFPDIFWPAQSYRTRWLRKCTQYGQCPGLHAASSMLFPAGYIGLCDWAFSPSFAYFSHINIRGMKKELPVRVVLDCSLWWENIWGYRIAAYILFHGKTFTPCPTGN